MVHLGGKCERLHTLANIVNCSQLHYRLFLPIRDSGEESVEIHGELIVLYFTVFSASAIAKSESGKATTQIFRLS